MPAGISYFSFTYCLILKFLILFLSLFFELCNADTLSHFNFFTQLLLNLSHLIFFQSHYILSFISYLNLYFFILFFFDPSRPGCPPNVMHIATRNLETLSEIISIVNPSEAAVGVKRAHGDLK